MYSIRSKITTMTVCAIIIAMTLATILGIVAIKAIGKRSAEQTLLLLCETGQKSLDRCFEDVEQSLEMISAYVEADLNGLDDEQLQAHLDRASGIFSRMTAKTSGVITYYYRIDPAVSQAVKGFWYVNMDGYGFREHEVTDIPLDEAEDTSRFIWFTVPKATGQPAWLPPYITESLYTRVISYNVPVYYKGRFVGVIGMEIAYSALAGDVDDITFYESGVAYITDAEGNLIYHPRMDVTAMKTPPEPPTVISRDTAEDSPFVRYIYEGVEKQAVWLPLVNGMRFNVAVSIAEIDAELQNWSNTIIISFSALLLVFVIFIMGYVSHITKPLRALTKAAEQVDAGNYDCKLTYAAQDEIGVLTQTFNRLTEDLKAHIGDLNNLAYADALTSLRNKGAFDIFIRNIQTQIDGTGEVFEFAVCIFDCNNLKYVNDDSGHDKGDIYLKEAATTICHVFGHSPVFRIGGDEFAALLTGSDYQHKEELLDLFDNMCAEKRTRALNAWGQVDVARGMAVYDPHQDATVRDVVRRADELMHENKRQQKKEQERAARRETLDS
ncbi:MAG: diguanylate cyclase [Bacteroidales bacterium]|nr:diguanylate cyclase [Bacteroidales bacterium]